jgi:hypothetical protein
MDTLLETIEEVRDETETASAPAVNSSFSTIEPRLQIAHDSTSIKAGMKCWRYYEYSILHGYGLSGPENDHLVFGTIFHAATELYDRLTARGADHQSAVRGAIRYTLAATWDFELGRPWVSQEPTKSRDTLLRTVILYLDKYKDSHLETLILANGKPAVEHHFHIDIEIQSPTGEDYILVGHLDKAVMFGDSVKIIDKKTTKAALDDHYFKQFSPDIQMSLYTFAGKIIFSSEIDGIMIDAAQILVNGSRFVRQPITRSDGELDEFFRDFQIYAKELERNISDNYWPKRETSCGFGRYRCAFSPVCSSDPAVRQEILDRFYTKRKAWDPKVPRTEDKEI